jgi:hypothetical protein
VTVDLPGNGIGVAIAAAIEERLTSNPKKVHFMIANV